MAEQAAKQGPVYAVGPTSALIKDGLTKANIPPTTIRSKNLEVRGHLVPLETFGEIPAAERGVVQQMAQRLGIPLTANGVNTALRLTNAYIARTGLGGSTPVTVNGVTLRPSTSPRARVMPPTRHHLMESISRGPSMILSVERYSKKPSRISIQGYNTQADADRLITALDEILNMSA